MKKLSFFNKSIFLINNIVAIILLLSFFVPYIKPSSFSLAPIAGLTIPALLLINVLFVIYWIIIGFRKQFLLSTVVLILGYLFSTPIYKFSSTSGKTDTNQLKIMSYNVRKFNIYKWIKDTNISQKIGEFITAEKADVVLLQEYRKDENFKIEYPYSFTPQSKRKESSGFAFFSKYQIINSGDINYYPQFGKSYFIDIVKNTDTIRIINFHLQSLGVIPDEEYFGYSDSEKLIDRLKNSLKLQQLQVELIQKHINGCRYKIILAGDLNNTAYSWTYRNLKSNLKDSYLETGSGFGKTYNFKGFPLRIDYIFASPSMKILQHENYKVSYSDHYPIMATVSF